MLYCERPDIQQSARKQFATLTDADRERAVAGFVDDVLTVCHHVVGDHYAYRDAWSQWPVLLDPLARRELPPLRVLARIVSWTLFTLQWRAKSRRLTPAERQLEAAAWRVSDCLHGPRHH